MGIFDRFKKRLTREQRDELERARRELRKTKEEMKIADEKDVKRLTKVKNFEVAPQLKERIERGRKEVENHLEQEQVKFNQDSKELVHTEDKLSEKVCHYCKNELVWPDINSCYYCQKNYCGEHRLAENHGCPKVMAAKHIEKGYLRKKGVNITTAKFAVICKNCGFTSGFAGIEEVNHLRIDHIRQNKCPSEKVQLRQNEEDRKADNEFVQKTYPTNQGNTWMYGCLEDAKKIILKNHSYEGVAEFFKDLKISINIQSDKEFAYGYIDDTYPHYRIGIHKSLERNSEESYRMVTVILIHELLHGLHADWSESEVSKEERRMANLGLHFDALQNLDLLYLSGKMRLCDK